MEIITVETAALGDRSYVLISGDEAAVIDPQRDVDRVVTVLEGPGLAPIARVRDPRAQRLRDRWPGAGRAEAEPPTWWRPPTT